MTTRELEEYRALRATIRERGTTRAWIVLAGFSGWAALLVATAALVALPVASLLPLLILAVTFEIVFSLHSGAERIGRYIQVFFEDGEPGWETHIMAFAQQFPVSGSDPLFSAYFWIGIAFNFVPVALAGPVLVEWLVVGSVHILFAVRVGAARRQSARQRALDLERFRRLVRLKADTTYEKSQPRTDEKPQART
jgi:hypothetical protein